MQLSLISGSSFTCGLSEFFNSSRDQLQKTVVKSYVAIFERNQFEANKINGQLKTHRTVAEGSHLLVTGANESLLTYAK